jgi:hypothetical protein
MTRVFLLSAVVVTVASLTGCGTARYVSKQGEGGVVAIPNNSDDWPTHYRQNAEALIRQHVGPNYEIVDEREVVTGTKVANNQQAQTEQIANRRNPSMPGTKETVTDTTTATNITEYRITYRRRGPVGGGFPGATAASAGLPPADMAGPGVVPVGGMVPAGVVPPVGPVGP